MKKKQNKRMMSGLAGATLLLSGCAAAVPAEVPEAPQAAPEVAEEVLEINGYKLETIKHAAIAYKKIAKDRTSNIQLDKTVQELIKSIEKM